MIILGCHFVITHQRVSGLVLVDGPHSSPVELLKQLESWRVEGVFTWHHTEEVREVLLGEHRVRICVGQLQHSDNTRLFYPKLSQRFG